MSGFGTRRDFLRTAAAGGSLVAHAWGSGRLEAVPAESSPGPVSLPAKPNEPPSATVEARGTSLSAPLLVVTQSAARDDHRRGVAWGYITEVLRRAGLFFHELSPDRLSWLASRPGGVVLLAGDLQLTAAQRETLATWVSGGGSLVGIGGTSGLDELFGVNNVRRLAEGWLKVTAGDHPLTAGLRSSLHVFGGCVVTPAAATSLAELQSGHTAAHGSAILERQQGQGRTVLLAPDLLFSIVHIQQGTPVFQDAKPAPDGSAATDDGILKAEDGMVLDWQRDRIPMAPDGVPALLEPVSDELREIILRSVFYLASQQGTRLPLLWYWPRNLPAVGHISHDTDGNDPRNAATLLDVMNRCQVKSTWCMLYPGGYPREFYGTLRQQGFEIGLHFDALSGVAPTRWSKEDLLFQRKWLLAEAELRHISTNKNHYTRWEGRLDFLRWCEDAGIHSDQTRGPSKQGTIGFALGGSQPYFPLDDEADTPRLIDVLEINLLTQDLAVVCPPEYGRQLVDSVLRHHGVAHFLFHPAHILKPPVAAALSALVEYGRTRGLEWWTSEQIHRWETDRRGVTATFDAGGQITLAAAKPLRQATLLLLKTEAQSNAIHAGNQSVPTRPWRLCGFEFDAVTLDIAGQLAIRTA